MKTFLTLLAATALGFSAWAGGPKTDIIAVGPKTDITAGGPKANTTASGPKAATSYKVIPEASNIVWLAKKVTGEHTGTVKFASGTIEANGPVLTGGTFLVDLSTIVNTDLKDAEYNGKLIGHLKSPDFFDVANHKEAKLVIKSAKPGKTKGTYDITADLTIKGITKPVTFPADVTVAADKVIAKATVTIDRTNYDIRYGSGKFFPSIGDKAIYDDFTLTLDLVASK